MNRHQAAAATQRDYARLSWQCRRGMLELDAMLLAFLDKDYARLSAVQRQAFEALLAYPDPLLLEVLMGRNTPFDKELADVAGRIRAAAGP